nr:serine/threonine protein kinase [Myxococcota bacterium]
MAAPNAPSPERPPRSARGGRLPFLATLLGGPFGLRSVLGMSPVPLPGSPEEVRDFFQRRLRLNLSIAVGMWIVLLVAVPLVIARDNHEEVARFLTQAGFPAHLVTTLLLLVTVLCLYRFRASLRVLQSIDFVSMVAQSVSIAMSFVHTAVKWRPELAVLIAMAAIHTLRAALVPTTAARSGLLWKLASIPILVGTYYAYQDQPGAGYPGGMTMMLMALVWCFVVGVVVTSISWVIYGLQLRVKEAAELGQYELEHKIGEGGMGIVYRARHALLRRPTAVKLLPPDRAGLGAIARFEREVRLTARLNHPNIVAVYDYGHTPEGLFYYAMEFLDGVDLERLVEADGPQPPGRVVNVLLQIASALAEAHHVGLIHRDVKPANVFLCRRGLELDSVKVLDFGLVRETASVDATQSTLNVLTGTPLYMSPEQITDPQHVDGRSDLYALGAVAYFLLTGEPPFTGSSVVEVCGHHLHTVPVRPSERLGQHLPEDLERLVLALLEKKPGQRPSDAQTLVRALRSCASARDWNHDRADEWWRERGTLVIERASLASIVPGTGQT